MLPLLNDNVQDIRETFYYSDDVECYVRNLDDTRSMVVMDGDRYGNPIELRGLFKRCVVVKGAPPSTGVRRYSGGGATASKRGDSKKTGWH